MQEDFSMLDLMTKSDESSGLILRLIKQNGMTRDELIKEFNLSPDEARTIIDGLMAKGLVREVNEQGVVLYKAVVRRKPQKRADKSGKSPLDGLFPLDE